ncbi:PilZ domain-containing protein [Bosea sp. PAMC 26642]|uniref:PilZ domain-containing protein n=1 Tax=Bosea sp. (strain PAMC 26642) TaxID=1792307 RepID=UPI0007705A27|nr:PilZ domain-containing protein [Bosea sp. PAMC 26642]AMJ59184.1 hypothetical protein AXW83_01700 [Bosea sp. PAMC 26642]
MMIDRRETRRERLHSRASIVFNGRQSIFACTLRNRSETGALLRLADWTELPAVFEVDARDGETLRVRQCWRRGDDVGVVFMTEEECEPNTPIDFAAFRALRARVAA